MTIDHSLIAARPPIGFLVEGDGEWNAYRSLVARGLDCDTRNVPIYNAQGVGSIVKRLENLLDSLVGSANPLHVVITVDQRDVLSAGNFATCRDACASLQERAIKWLAGAQIRGANAPHPLTITVVFQDPMFEAWLIADGQALVATTEIMTLGVAPVWQNVDEEVKHPASWLQRHLKPGIDVKNPSVPKAISRNIDPVRASSQSHSFEKFWREVVRCHRDWALACDWVP